VARNPAVGGLAVRTMKHWRRSLAALMVAAMAVVVAAPADADHGSLRSARVKVMSQNLYIGADISRLLPSEEGPGESPAAVLGTVLQTDYPARAKKIAQAIDDFNPDIIGLQEVWTISTFTAEATVFELDFLEILMAELAARGESFAVSSVSTNADVTLPVDPATGLFGRVVDADVIIHRTSTTQVQNPTENHFAVNFVAPLGNDVFIEFTRGWHAVDATVRGDKIRFVNTHLEVQGAPCLDEGAWVICQEAQAAELAKILAGQHGLTVLVGDFNAEPDSYTYQTIDDAGFLDTWTERYPYNDEPGFTCCQDELLNNEVSALTQRIDHIFLSESPVRYLFAITTVVGDWEERKTESGLWYSDHGGPYADLRLVYRS
jgi:endonuclease/exonuclease/phosphatase family metal-dependent hydrolase